MVDGVVNCHTLILIDVPQSSMPKHGDVAPTPFVLNPQQFFWFVFFWGVDSLWTKPATKSLLFVRGHPLKLRRLITTNRLRLHEHRQANMPAKQSVGVCVCGNNYLPTAAVMAGTAVNKSSTRPTSATCWTTISTTSACQFDATNNLKIKNKLDPPF